MAPGSGLNSRTPSGSEQVAREQLVWWTRSRISLTQRRPLARDLQHGSSVVNGNAAFGRKHRAIEQQGAARGGAAQERSPRRLVGAREQVRSALVGGGGTPQDHRDEQGRGESALGRTLGSARASDHARARPRDRALAGFARELRAGGRQRRARSGVGAEATHHVQGPHSRGHNTQQHAVHPHSSPTASHTQASVRARCSPPAPAAAPGLSVGRPRRARAARAAARSRRRPLPPAAAAAAGGAWRPGSPASSTRRCAMLVRLPCSAMGARAVCSLQHAHAHDAARAQMASKSEALICNTPEWQALKEHVGEINRT